jgi:malonyl-CoA O-methyltransferase
MTAGQRFARVATTLAVRSPATWRLFRGPLRRMFDGLAPAWEARASADKLASLDAALERLARPPQRILDVGTGTGSAARHLAARWPDAEVTGLDLSPEMLVEAARLGGGPRYVAGDASRLPFADESFDLVVLLNMIPFFDELARVSATGGSVAISYTLGPATPIFVPLDRVDAELARRGFGERHHATGGRGLALLATKS